MMVVNYFREAALIAEDIDVVLVDKMIERLAKLKHAEGRLFIIGVGGSAANASHAVNDFRKLCKIKAYTPTDNVAELTARTNDNGWDAVFFDWLLVEKIQPQDALFVLSVGGGRWDASRNIIAAVQLRPPADIMGIVGPEGGYTAAHGDLVLKVPATEAHFSTATKSSIASVPLEPKYVTAYTEAFQMLVLHCIVNDERLRS